LSRQGRYECCCGGNDNCNIETQHHSLLGNKQITIKKGIARRKERIRKRRDMGYLVIFFCCPFWCWCNGNKASKLFVEYFRLQIAIHRPSLPQTQNIPTKSTLAMCYSLFHCPLQVKMTYSISLFPFRIFPVLLTGTNIRSCGKAPLYHHSEVLLEPLLHGQSRNPHHSP